MPIFQECTECTRKVLLADQERPLCLDCREKLGLPRYNFLDIWVDDEDGRYGFWGPNSINKGGVTIGWICEGAGFGSISLVVGAGGELEMDSEYKNKDFVKALMCALIDRTSERQ